MNRRNPSIESMIMNLLLAGHTQEETAERTGVTQATVSRMSLKHQGNQRRKVSPEKHEEIRRLAAEGNLTQKQIGDRFGIRQCTVSQIVNRTHKTYR